MSSPTPAPQPERDVLGAALEYAARGWRVFPVVGKLPLPGTHGFKDATRDVEQIRHWLKEHPGAGVAIATGRVSGVVVLDFDPRNGAEKSLAALPLPDAPEVQTGGGGFHLYFSAPGFPLPCRPNLWPGIDLKADGGYVVAPPSRHPSGAAYRWSSDYGNRLEFPPLPDFVIQRAHTARNEPAAPLPEKIYEGEGRDNALTSLAGSMRRRGASEAAMLAALEVENRTRCVPPLDEKDLRRIAHSNARYQPAAEEVIVRRQTPRTGEVEPAKVAYVPRCYSLQELADNPPAPLDWLVDRLLQERGITGLIGRPKIGKSFVLQYLALCVAAGVDFLGRKVKPGRALYIDEEMPQSVVFARWLRMRAAHPAFNAPETLQRYFTVSLGGLSIEKPDEIRREIEKAEPRLLIVDSFRRVFRGEENASKEIAGAMAFFADLRSEYGLDLAIAHHTRKNLEGSEFWEDAARGSSDFFAACDGMLGLGKRGKGLAELRATLRAAAEPEPVNLAFNEETLIWEITSRQPEAAGFDSLKAIKEILESKPERRWPQKLVAQALQTGFSRTEKQAEKALARLPTFKDHEQPPLSVQVFKRLTPGTHNEREVILGGQTG